MVCIELLHAAIGARWKVRRPGGGGAQAEAERVDRAQPPDDSRPVRGATVHDRQRGPSGRSHEGWSVMVRSTCRVVAGGLAHPDPQVRARDRTGALDGHLAPRRDSSPCFTTTCGTRPRRRSVGRCAFVDRLIVVRWDQRWACEYMNRTCKGVGEATAATVVATILGASTTRKGTLPRRSS